MRTRLLPVVVCALLLAACRPTATSLLTFTPAPATPPPSLPAAPIPEPERLPEPEEAAPEDSPTPEPTPIAEATAEPTQPPPPPPEPTPAPTPPPPPPPPPPTPQPTAAPESVHLTSENNGGHVRLVAGDTLTITLDECCDASWSYDGPPPDGRVLPETSDRSEPAGANGHVRRMWTFTAAAPGRTEVRLAYVQDGNPTPTKHYTVAVEVT